MVDQTKIKEAVRLLLEGIGEDVTREGLRETPDRIARMYGEIFAGMDEDAGEHLTKTFTVASNEIVLLKNITFYSTCEHHLMPFYGKAHIAYLPDGKVVGLSKLARTVEAFARRPQIQEQMTIQIVEAVMEHLKPRHGDGGGGAYVHDYEGGGKAGKQDNDGGVQRLLSGRSQMAGTILSDDRR